MLKFVPDTWCPVLGDEDPKDLKSAEQDYEYLKAKGEKIKEELTKAGKIWTSFTSLTSKFDFL